jgi:hypothetical protein
VRESVSHHYEISPEVIVVKSTSINQTRPIIAVDIDDVLAQFVPAFLIYAREKWNENVTQENFTEEWAKIFKVKGMATIKARAIQMFADFDFYNGMKTISDAPDVLKKMSQKFTLIPMTSRVTSQRDLTVDWLDRNFGNVFEEVIFSGAYEAKNDFRRTVHKTKGDICQEIGASFLIDDQPKHVNAAAECGVEALLFGDYSWNRHAKIVTGVTRVADWGGVADYFGV